MSTPLQSPRGTRDILPEQQPLWQHVIATAHKIGAQLNFQPITVPTYEELALFQRSIGQGTDVMDKELFLVKGIRSEEENQYALRPEGTAGIVRAFIQHGMRTWPQPVKLYSIVNNFRYDRPQKGRYREHMQFDIEYFGETGPFADAWVIYATWQFLSSLGMEGVQLQLNTLGTSEERSSFAEALRSHLEKNADQLSADSKHRLSVNPLRILDSKDANDQRLLESAPTLMDHLSAESKERFEAVKSYVQNWNIPFVMNPKLVRGLDYYSHTAFEWTVLNEEGQQGSLGGGGRYDSLPEQLGSTSNGAVGAGMGLDRVVEELIRQGKAVVPKPAHLVSFVAEGRAEQAASQPLISQAIAAGWRVEAHFAKASFGSQLKAASKAGAAYAVLLGSEELANATITIKNMADGSQAAIPQADLADYLTHAA